MLHHFDAFVVPEGRDHGQSLRHAHVIHVRLHFHNSIIPGETACEVVFAVGTL